MNTDIELLAPAGNIETFEKVIDDADAVYCGLRNFNARMRGRNFSYDELSAAVKYARSVKKKVYAAFNTLIKEKELPKAIEQLQFLNEIKIDAVIIQDLGLLNIVNQFFPALAVHASTQMFLADEYALKFAEKNNIKRIILPRELSIGELEKLNEKSRVDLEVFAHGALCYSISGYCLMSHYIGRQSANRGFCGQPCRRQFFQKQTGREKNGDASQFFSMADLCAIEYLPELLKLEKIKSLKIEGRLKTPDTLQSIVKSYRRTITAISENPTELDKIIAEEKKRLAENNNRPVSSGYLDFSVSSKIAFTEGQSDLYSFAGSVIEADPEKIKIQAACRFEKNSKMKIERAKKRISFSIQKMFDADNNEITEAKPDETVFISPSVEIQRSDLIFVLKKNEQSFNEKSKISPLKLKITKCGFLSDADKTNRILNNFQKPQNSFSHKPKTQSIPSEYHYVNEKQLTSFSGSFLKKHNIIIEIIMDAHSDFSEWKRLSNNNCIIALSLVLNNADFKSKIQNIIERGFTNFMIAHISQLEFMRELTDRNLNLYANNTIYITNTAAADFIRLQKFKGFVFAVENELHNIELINSDLQKFIFIKHKPALFISRAANKKIQLDSKYADEYGKVYSLEFANNLLSVLPVKPLSLEIHQKFFYDKNINIIIKQQ